MEKLKGTLGKKSQSCNNVAPDTWVNHFSSLNKNDPETVESNMTRCNDIDGKLNALFHQRLEGPCPIMDKEFSLKDILDGIRLLIGSTH